MTSTPRGRAGTASLHFELLGGFAASFGDGRPCVLPTRKSQALLAYLALPAGRFHSREKVTALLWGDTPEVQARADWDEPTEAVYRAVNVGRTTYEEVTVFFLDRPDAVPQPIVE